jgi:hypothetical protein
VVSLTSSSGGYINGRNSDTIHKAFSHRNYGSKFVVLGYNSTYFSNKIHKGKTLDFRLSKRSLEFFKTICDLCHYASKQFHNISVVPLLLQTESLSGE